MKKIVKEKTFMMKSGFKVIMFGKESESVYEVEITNASSKMFRMRLFDIVGEDQNIKHMNSEPFSICITLLNRHGDPIRHYSVTKCKVVNVVYDKLTYEETKPLLLDVMLEYSNMEVHPHEDAN